MPCGRLKDEGRVSGKREVKEIDRYITNAAGFEADLQSVHTDKLDVRVVIATLKRSLLRRRATP